jgi:hypothetical protein
METEEVFEDLLATVKEALDSRWREKLNLDQTFDTLRARGWSPALTPQSYERIASCGFRTKALALAIVASEILVAGQPMTLRGLFYRVVSGGWFPSTDKQHYQTLMRIMTILREAGAVPFRWIVDGVRSTIKPSSWSGLADFTETVRDAYRKDFWARLSNYVHIFCEKDAMAGTVAPVTREYDVPLSVIRGFSSVSYAHEIAEQWREIRKPIFAFYLGDLDPSGLELERDMREKLARYSQREFSWQRLAVTQPDFSLFNLFPLAPKEKDVRTKRFLEQGYTQCAELDAVPATELRNRIEQAILSHIPAGEWERLQNIERLERDQWQATLEAMSA